MSYIQRNTIKKMFYWKSRLNVTNFIVYLPSTLKSCVASFYPLSNVLYRCIFLKEFPLNDEETKPQESQLTGSELHRQNREGWFRRQPTCYIRQKTKERKTFCFLSGSLDYQCPIPWAVSVSASECQLNFHQSPCRNLILRRSLLTGISFSVAGISVQQHLQYVRIMNLHIWIFSKNAT